MSNRKGTPRKRKGHAGGSRSPRHTSPQDHAANPGGSRRAPKGPMGGNRTAVTILAVLLVAGLIAFGVAWAVAWG